jgi:hypothetical protein
MAYIPQWERLSDSLMRVMTTARLSKEEAQTDLCRAIADGAVKIRGKLRTHTTIGLHASDAVLEGKTFHIPTEIKPNDLDWEASRPVKPWIVQRGTSQPQGYWELEWIELLRADVTSVLCTAGKRSEPAQHASSKARATRRSRPAFERAQGVIKVLYPQGVPGQAAEPNWKLYRRVVEKLKKDGLPHVSDDTILRAAGRRK